MRSAEHPVHRIRRLEQAQHPQHTGACGRLLAGRRGGRVRVLLQGRSARSVAGSPGGDQVMLEATAAALRTERGIDAEVSFDAEPDLSEFDAVHLFGLTRPQESWVR